MKYYLERQNANEDEAKVVDICFENGDAVDVGSIIMILETSKAAIEIVATEAGPITTTVAIGDNVATGAVLAYQNEKPPQRTQNCTKKTIVSTNALSLIEKYGIKVEDLGKTGYVRASDVLEFINGSRIQSNESAPLTSPLDSYIEPPVAYLNFSYKINPTQTSDHEVEFWNRYVKPLSAELNSSFAHNIINNDGNIQPFECDLTHPVTRNDLTKSAINVFRGKKTKQKVSICISYLKSRLDFSHVALLYPGSKMTLAVAECEITNTANISICYDHRHLHGYQILKIIEKCNDL